jgi:hypothetical protein
MTQIIYTDVSMQDYLKHLCTCAQDYLKHMCIHEKEEFFDEKDTWAKLQRNSSGLLRLPAMQVRQHDRFRDVIFKVRIIRVVFTQTKQTQRMVCRQDSIYSHRNPGQFVQAAWQARNRT